MAYEVFTRTSFRVGEPSISLTPDGRIGLNAAAGRILMEMGVKAVLLLWDRANSRMALKAATRDDKNSYAVSIPSGKNRASIRARSFLTHVGWNAPTRISLPATWNEKNRMFETLLPRKYLVSPARPIGMRIRVGAAEG